MLFIQADGCLRAVFLFVEKAKELLVILPVPTGIADVGETFTLDLVRDVVEARKDFRRGRTFRAEGFLAREPESTDTGENFQPGKKELAQRAERAKDPAPGDVIDREKGSGEDAKSADLLRNGGLVAAQRDTQHSHPEGDEKPE